MPRIFDNIEQSLLPALRELLAVADGASFCVGYLNLRGWKAIADLVERLTGEDESHACRLLVGMHRPPEDLMREAQRGAPEPLEHDRPTLIKLRQRIAADFREQIEFGVPTAEAAQTLRQLAAQLRSGKVRLKLFLRYPLHAKLYLVHRRDPAAPLVGFVGSSNLTQAGLRQQGELNVDVVEQDAARKLQQWFDERWNDAQCVDLTSELAGIIEQSWAAERLFSPYHVYLKMAWHLSEDAREGERSFKVPRIFEERGTPLLDFQTAAVQLACRRLYKHGGVLLADVVGLGKTLMATAVALTFQQDEGGTTLIICPPKLEEMWRWYKTNYGLNAEVLSLGAVVRDLPHLPPHNLVLIDESHNLRNRETKRYRVIADYIERCRARVLLLTATPYNKQFADLSSQLRLFVDEDADLHVRPERFFREWLENGGTEGDFIAQFQTSPCSLRAFEKSPHPEDWRDLMRHYMVRRTRRFVIENYASFDAQHGRHYVLLHGERRYFPVRQPRTVKFEMDEHDPADPYARLYQDGVVRAIGELALPRYGLAHYLVPDADRRASTEERQIIANLNRAGKRLLGFCRTNLFKRLESDGWSFLSSVARHIHRNLVHVYAIEHGLPLPIGTQDAAEFDPWVTDREDEFARGDNGEGSNESVGCVVTTDLSEYRRQAEAAYQHYRQNLSDRFDWLDPKFFRPTLRDDLLRDAETLLGILRQAGRWNPDQDTKLQALLRFLTRHHPREKVLVFTQFADTAHYLARELRRAGLSDFEAVTSDSGDPVALARRFSPSTNGGLREGESELRVLIATDVLAEGQNLQDAHIVVNFDLPWAIIRLVQRAGRVDRIGQRHDTIFVYSFMPADGVERIIRLRSRLQRRLEENQEVIGTDETFFGEEARRKLHDLYTEKQVLDEEDDDDVDLVSVARQVWNKASEADRKAALALPAVVPAARPARPRDEHAEPETPGVIVYLRYPDGTDALVRVGESGRILSQSLGTIFRAAACGPETPAVPLDEDHFKLVGTAVRAAHEEQCTLSGQLGSFRSIRRKLYERLKRYREHIKTSQPLFAADILSRLDPLLDAILRRPLTEEAKETLGRQMRLGISDDSLADNVARLDEEGRLCQPAESREPADPKILCSLGIRKMS